MAGSRVPETICAHVDKSVKQQALTLARAVVALQDKIEANLDDYARMPLAQTITKGDGKKVTRNNPAAEEFRATVRSYSAALRDLHEILANNSKASEISPLDEMRKAFKIS